MLFKYAPIPVFLASSSVLKLKLVTHEAYMLDRDVFCHAWMLFDLILYFESVELGVVCFLASFAEAPYIHAFMVK